MTDDHNGAGGSVFHDHAAEAATLGAMLLNGDVIAEVEAIVPAGAFHLPVHQLLFTTLTELRQANEPTDPVSVVARLAQTGQLSKVPDNGVYVQALPNQCPTAANGTYYARIVADRATLRDLDAALARARQMIRAGGHGDSALLVERARLMVAELSERATGQGGWVHWSELFEPGLNAMEERAESGEDTMGVATGLIDLDKVLSGLQKQRLYVIAGQPGSGKSTLASDFVREAAFRRKVPTGVFTMEMPRLEFFNRIICAEASVPAERVAHGTLDDRDWAAIAKAAGETDDSPLWFDDAKNLTMADIVIRAKKLHQRHTLGLLVVDYLGLIVCNDNKPRHQQVDELVKAFKWLAGDLGIPIVLLAQMNRNASQRGDKRPILQDLKESGGIEAHADAVIFVHREEQFDKSKRRGEADLIVAKNRSGPQTDVVVAAQLYLNRFASITPERTTP